MKTRKSILMLLVVLLLLSYSCLVSYAINSGFELSPISDEEKFLIENNIDLSIFESETFNKTIDCFDVSDEGLIAIGTSNSNDKYISIYDSQGVFQLGYRFNCNGSFGVEWDSNNIIIYLVRSDIACLINQDGTIKEVFTIENTQENDSYWNNQVFSTTRVVGNVEYRLQNDMGFLNAFSSSYSQLVAQHSNGEIRTIYDVNSQQLLKSLIVLIFILLFVASVLAVLIRQNKAKINKIK